MSKEVTPLEAFYLWMIRMNHPPRSKKYASGGNGCGGTLSSTGDPKRTFGIGSVAGGIGNWAFKLVAPQSFSIYWWPLS